MECKQLWAILTLAATAPSAQAALLTYDFTVTATSGALIGESSNGSFSFDESIIPSVIPDGGVSVGAEGLLADLEFVWNGITYDETSANTGFFIFRPGRVFDACFGNNAGAGGCAVGALTNEWYVSLYSIGGGQFAYATPESFIGEGTVTYKRVPEPSILALIGTGIAGLFATRSRPNSRSFTSCGRS